MQHLKRIRLVLCAVAFAIVAFAAGKAHAQASYPPVNDEVPNPYQPGQTFGQLPNGRKWGSVSGVSVGPDGNIWALDRCGGSNCKNSDLDPVLEFDPSGKLLKSFGSGLIVAPHGLRVDKDGNVWVTDSQGREGEGQQVYKFSPDGKILMRLGRPGSQGEGPDTLNSPNTVAIAKNGDIFVADGHSPTCGMSRIVKFSQDGKFLTAFGHKGSGPGDLMCPHSIAFDSKGRLFVANVGDNRVSIFDKNGKFLMEWRQFGRATGLFIDSHDILYVTDSGSSDQHAPPPKEGAPTDGPVDYGYNPGCKRGLRFGSVKDGKVIGFIPDPSPVGNSTFSEQVAVDAQGNIYGAEVGPKDLKKYVKKQP